MTDEISVPGFKHLPDRVWSHEFLSVRAGIFDRIDPYYDRDHLTRAGDWMLAVAPDASEFLVIAALTHDLERSVPGGPWLDLAEQPWDDPEYNRLHCERSAELVPGILRGMGASEALAEAVRSPIREHEFGGSPEGDLMQAADSLSFLETNGRLCADWVHGGKCSREKVHAKLEWMRDRVRLERAKPMARIQHRASVAAMEQWLEAAVPQG